MAARLWDSPHRFEVSRNVQAVTVTRTRTMSWAAYELYLKKP
jgi:hypothetical protein